MEACREPGPEPEHESHHEPGPGSRAAPVAEPENEPVHESCPSHESHHDTTPEHDRLDAVLRGRARALQ